MTNPKKLKLTNRIKNVIPKLKWTMFTEFQNFKITSEYIDLICPEKNNSNPTKNLRNMVAESIKKEFPNIKNEDSFNLLVDSVIHKLQKKSIEN